MIISIKFETNFKKIIRYRTFFTIFNLSHALKIRRHGTYNFWKIELCIFFFLIARYESYYVGNNKRNMYVVINGDLFCKLNLQIFLYFIELILGFK